MAVEKDIMVITSIVASNYSRQGQPQESRLVRKTRDQIPATGPQYDVEVVRFGRTVEINEEVTGRWMVDEC